MVFEYMSRTVSDAFIDIDDIGNCSLVAYTLDATTFAMVVSTVMGTTEIYYCGPVGAGLVLGDYCSTTYKKFPYSESKIKNAINKFVNTEGIMQVMQVSPEEAMSKFVDIAKRKITDEC